MSLHVDRRQTLKDRWHDPGLDLDQILVDQTNGPAWVADTLVDFVIEAVEPSILVTPLFDTVELNRPGGPVLRYPVKGSVTVGTAGENGEYPETSDRGEILFHAGLGKVGGVISLTEEQRRQDALGQLRLKAEDLGRALARYKEQQVLNAMAAHGSVVIDNGDSSIKSSTGRDSTGTYSNGLSVFDITYAIDQLINARVLPQTLICHPKAAPIFRTDAWRSFFSDNPYPISLLWTFYAPFDAAANTVDLLLVDSSNIGQLLVDQRPHQQDYEIRERDIFKMKVSESYGIHILLDGTSIAQLKGISLDQSWDMDQSFAPVLTGALGSALTGDASHAG